MSNSQQPLVECSWHEARHASWELANSIEAEQVAVAAVAGRVLANDIHALNDLPNFDSSAMDGWAVSGEGPWRIVGDVRAGVVHDRPLEPGQTVRIATGAVMPVGAEAVVRWEDADVADDVVSAASTPGRDIRRAGEECAAGDLIAATGTTVNPALVGLIAATGHDEVQVRRRPSIALLLLGDELLTHGVPEAGRIRDSLGPQLPGWLERMGAQVTSFEHIDDEVDSVVAGFAQAAARAEIVITTGGTAAGPRDHVHAAISANNGRLIVDRVAVKPGHPMLLAQLTDAAGREVPLVGLPGNPHSAVVGLMTVGQPVIERQLGRPETILSRVPTSTELHGSRGHTRLVAGNVIDGVFELSPYGGSAMLRGLAQSSGFAIVPESGIGEGDLVEWLPLP